MGNGDPAMVAPPCKTAWTGFFCSTMIRRAVNSDRFRQAMFLRGKGCRTAGPGSGFGPSGRRGVGQMTARHHAHSVTEHSCLAQCGTRLSAERQLPEGPGISSFRDRRKRLTPYSEMMFKRRRETACSSGPGARVMVAHVTG